MTEFEKTGSFPHKMFRGNKRINESVRIMESRLSIVNSLSILFHFKVNKVATLFQTRARIFGKSKNPTLSLFANLTAEFLKQNTENKKMVKKNEGNGFTDE